LDPGNKSRGDVLGCGKEESKNANAVIPGVRSGSALAEAKALVELWQRTSALRPMGEGLPRRQGGGWNAALPKTPYVIPGLVPGIQCGAGQNHLNIDFNLRERCSPCGLGPKNVRPSIGLLALPGGI